MLTNIDETAVWSENIKVEQKFKILKKRCMIMCDKKLSYKK